MGRYPMIDRATKRSIMKDQVTFMVSITSAHYRVGYISTWGLHCYLNLEQVFDLHENRTGVAVRPVVQPIHEVSRLIRTCLPP